MAQWQYDPRVDHRHMAQTAPTPPAFGGMVNLIGAVLSVALVAGVAVWSYRLMVRDVSGIPVVRALDGPMRISPSDPGGRQAAYQGLSVNSVAAQGGGVPAVPDEVVLAPAPVDLMPEDTPGARALAPVGVEPVISAPQLATPAPLGLEVAQPLDAGLPTAQPAVMTGGVAPISRSPVPPRRPATLAARAPGAGSIAPANDSVIESLLLDVATRLSAPEVVEIDPAALVPGTRLVQLGAYEDPSEARAAWDAMAQRFGAHLEGRGRVIEPATSGGRVFYRLRAHGFADEPSARRFCSVLLAEGADCIPVLIR
jgi:hypothetical protein